MLALQAKKACGTAKLYTDLVLGPQLFHIRSIYSTTTATTLGHLWTQLRAVQLRAGRLLAEGVRPGSNAHSEALKSLNRNIRIASIPI